MTDPDLIRKVRAVLAEGNEIETARRPSFGLERPGMSECSSTQGHVTACLLGIGQLADVEAIRLEELHQV